MTRACLLFVIILSIELRREITKAGILTFECQTHGTNRAVTLFADNDFGGASFFRFLVINLIPVNKHDQVGILLDPPRFTQAGRYRAFVWTVLQRSVEL